MHPKRHLLLQHIVGYLQLIAQFLRTDAIPIVFDLLLIESVDHDGLDRQTLEVKVAVLEGKSEVDVAEVVVVEDLTHGLDLREYFGVFVEDGLQIFWDLEGAGVLVVDRPVALGDCQAVELLEG